MGNKDNKKQRFRTPRRGPGGPMGFEKPQNFKLATAKILKYSKPHYTPTIIAVVLAAIGALLCLIGPNVLSEITNLIGEALPVPNAETGFFENLFATLNVDRVVKLAIILGSVYIASFIFTYAQGYIMATVTQRLSKRMRHDISTKINKLPLSYFDANTFGDVLSRITNDVDTIGQSLSNSIVSLFSSAALLIGCVVMMFITNWIMALSAIVASFIGFVCMALIMSKSQKYFNAIQQFVGGLNGNIEEAYSSHSVIKLYNAEHEVKKNFAVQNQGIYNNAWKSQLYSGLMGPLMGFIGNLGYVVVCVVGAVLVMNGFISYGVIVAFIIYVRLFSSPLSTIAQGLSSLQSAAAAGERVFEFLEEKEEYDESSITKKLKNVRGEVEFKNVKFGYKENKIIINDFSARIKAGSKVAIVGPTGAGKTTLVNLLMRFYNLNDGQILIDGVPTTDITRENVHDLFSMVLQDTWLFEGSIKENIVYSKKGVTDDMVFEACIACGIDHFIKTLPQGYDTIMNDNITISAGQKQLLTIARAMIQNSPMLILDEATSSVDTRTEVLIQKAMDKLTKGRTSFVIAHRLSTIKNADAILVLKDGDIVEQGNHKKLMEQNGFYAELYNSQFDPID